MENYLPKTMDFYLPKSMDFSLPFTFNQDAYINNISYLHKTIFYRDKVILRVFFNSILK
jgi:hypothetical protein